ncbi:MAG: hypothetical protein WD768_06170 [Phycisphaeraceae bacterium]
MQTRSVNTIVTDGTLPPFWPRRAVFFANLMSLFFGNESGTRTLREEVGEIDSYGGRLIPILNLLFRGGSNMLVLEHEPDAPLCTYFRQELGLSLPTLSGMSHDSYSTLGRCLAQSDADEADRMLVGPASHEAEWIDGFVTDETLSLIAHRLRKRTISTCEGSRRGNNKYLLHAFLESAGLPTADTLMAASPAQVPDAIRELSSRGYFDAVLKAQIGASGIGLLKLKDIAAGVAVEAIPEHLFFEGPCMVQGWLGPGVLGVKSVRSPSVQLFLDEESVYQYDMTEQILSDDSVHEGNVSPPPYLGSYPGLREEMLRQAGEAGRWLHSQGYRGTASADLLLIEREGKGMPEVYICEINARVTGATYPSVLARHFTPQGAWLLRNVRLKEPMAGDQLLARFREPHHLYLPGKNVGVLPINFNFGPEGLIHKGQFLCLAREPQYCHELLELAKMDLRMEWQYERD